MLAFTFTWKDTGDKDQNQRSEVARRGCGSATSSAAIYPPSHLLVSLLGGMTHDVPSHFAFNVEPFSQSIESMKGYEPKSVGELTPAS